MYTCVNMCTWMYIYIYICIYITIYICMDLGVVRPCRGQRKSFAQSEPDCVGGRWVLPRLPWEVSSRTSHGSAQELPNFHWPSQALTLPKKYVDFRSLFLRQQIPQKSFVCRGEFEAIPPFHILNGPWCPRIEP